jgi:hypothetical protein
MADFPLRAADFPSWLNDLPVESLVIPLAVIIQEIFINRATTMVLTEEHHPVSDLPLE